MFLMRSMHSGIGGFSVTRAAILPIVPSAIEKVSQSGCEQISSTPSNGVMVCNHKHHSNLINFATVAVNCSFAMQICTGEAITV